MSTPRSRRSPLAAAALSAALLMSACTGGGDADSPEEPEKKPGGASTSEVTVTAAVGRLAGTLDKAGRQAVVDKAVALVEAWWGKAYLGGGYPRVGFADAFPGFTGGAAKLAKADAALLSNAAIGPRIDGVEAVTKQVTVDVLSPRRTPAAATARFRLEFTTSGEVAQQSLVKGRLMLAVDRKGVWRIVGYDVSRSDAPTSEGATP